MNLYPPLRLHPVTRGAVNSTVMRYKKLGLIAMRPEVEESMTEDSLNTDEPLQESLFYYGLVLTDTSVITIFKSNIKVTLPQ